MVRYRAALHPVNSVKASPYLSYSLLIAKYHKQCST